MLPLFTFAGQQALIAVHRWAGLAITLVAVVFADLEVPGPARK
jgi:hypothetical protein